MKLQDSKDSDDIINAQGGNDTLFGRPGNDLLRGGDGDDTLLGGRGDDTLEGGNGNDSLLGRDDNDHLRGDAGNDILSSSRGIDILEGGDGNDILGGGLSADTLTGDSGSDTFRYLSLKQSMLEGFDIITDVAIGTGDEADILNGPTAVSAADLVQAGTVSALTEAGIQTVLTSDTFIQNGAATFTFATRTFVALNNGVAGYQQATDGLIEITGYSGNLSSLAIAGLPSQDSLFGDSSHNELQGTSNNDMISGQAGNDTLLGSTGNDTLQGNVGNDTLIGSRGIDVLMGGAGDDILGGGLDADTLTGGSGSDTFRYLATSQSRLGAMDVITDLTIGTDIIDSINVLSTAEVVQAGNVATLDETSIQAILTTGYLIANGAATFSVGSREFLVLNDGVAGYQQVNDGLVEITGYTGDLANLAIT